MRTTFLVFLLLSGFRFLFLLFVCLFVCFDRHSLYRAGWLRTQRFACFCLLSAGIKDVYYPRPTENHFLLKKIVFA